MYGFHLSVFNSDMHIIAFW